MVPWGAPLAHVALHTWPAPPSEGLVSPHRSCWCSSPMWSPQQTALSYPQTAGPQIETKQGC